MQGITKRSQETGKGAEFSWYLLDQTAIEEKEAKQMTLMLELPYIKISVSQELFGWWIKAQIDMVALPYGVTGENRLWGVLPLLNACTDQRITRLLFLLN